MSQNMETLFVVEMPYTEDGLGPAEPHETAYVRYEVWDYGFATVASFATREEADAMMEARK